MRRAAVVILLLTSSATSISRSAHATVRSFVYSHESRVLAEGESELEPWTTFRAGRSRYYSALDGRLGLARGLSSNLQLSLYWSFQSETKDVVQDSLTGELERVTNSEFASASLNAKYQLSDRSADLLGAALYFEGTLGPRQSELEAKLILDRSVGAWLFAANATAELQLSPRRDAEGSKLGKELRLEPTLALAYELPHGVSAGLELRAPLDVGGDAKSRTLFGGPVLRFADRGFWAALGAQPQLLAFSGKSEGSRLDLNEHERLEVRLLAGCLL